MQFDTAFPAFYNMRYDCHFPKTLFNTWVLFFETIMKVFEEVGGFNTTIQVTFCSRYLLYQPK